MQLCVNSHLLICVRAVYMLICIRLIFKRASRGEYNFPLRMLISLSPSQIFFSLMLRYFFDLSPLFSPRSRRCPSLRVCLLQAAVSGRVACVIREKDRKEKRTGESQRKRNAARLGYRRETWVCVFVPTDPFSFTG